jgi:hypothetical protein
MKRLITLIWMLLAFRAVGTQGQTALSENDAWIHDSVPHPGGDQIYWVPTLTQAERMAKETGRPIFLMGYVASWDGW